MVMPFSFSRSIESMRRSSCDSCWLARKVPDCLRRQSTSVVLPWSTWAMMAIFRMCCMSTGPACAGSRVVSLSMPKGQARAPRKQVLPGGRNTGENHARMRRFHGASSSEIGVARLQHGGEARDFHLAPLLGARLLEPALGAIGLEQAFAVDFLFQAAQGFFHRFTASQ